MKIKKLIVVLGALIPAGFLFYPTSFLSMTACAVPTQHYTRKPAYTNLFSFPTFDIPPAAKPASLDLTAVIIIPEYKDTYTQQYAGGAQVSSRGSMTTDMLKVFKSFAGSVGEANIKVHFTEDVTKADKSIKFVFSRQDADISVYVGDAELPRNRLLASLVAMKAI